MTAALKVGDVARKAGVNLQTIHYYERRGLLPEPPRTGSNYRAYPPDARANVKIRNIDEKVRTLQAMRRALSKLMSECIGRSPISECPILDALDPRQEKRSSGRMLPRQRQTVRVRQEEL
jgi:DNA-binding transcriptional MerR regulator